MIDLTTHYMGLELRNPIIAASSGLTETIEDLKEFEDNGAGAVVIKSIFEEEIRQALEKDMQDMNRSSFLYPETMDYYDNYSQDDALTNHLKLIRDAKSTLSIPVIASVNCVSAEKWTYYAETMEQAGADAIELNMFILPSDLSRTAEENEQIYFDVAEKVKKLVKIPVSMKISYYSSNLATFIQKLSNTGIDGIVLFNRFYSPDIDINNFEVTATNVLSMPSEISISLRWIAIMAERVGCDLAASTGIHDGPGVIKQILAGANAVELASTFYKNGKGVTQDILHQVTDWMKANDFTNLNQFRGKMSFVNTQNPAAYQRVQFMKYFAGKGM